MDQITVTREQARKAFAQWWADFQADPEKFGTDADLEGKDSADTFFEYSKQFEAA